MFRIHLLTIAIATMMVSGCISLEEPEPTDAASPTTTATRGGSSAGATANSGTMTGKETTATTTNSCARDATDSFVAIAAVCATKTHWLEGELSISTLPIQLISFNGNVDVQGGTAGTWNLTVVLRARGDTDATARTNLENIQFTWSHESGGQHHLKAEAKKRNQQIQNQESARMTLTVPASILITLDATTTNGEATARGVRADDLELTTTNGRVLAQDVEAENVVLVSTNGQGVATTVDADTIEITTSNGAISVTAAARVYKLQTTNGAVDAKLRPSASGEARIGSTNGAISLSLPEGDKHGHDLSATTTNGVVTVSLKDGSTSGTNTAKTFKTTDYAKRTIQTKTTVTSTNAMVTVSPFAA